MAAFSDRPARAQYDVVIVGGAMMGASVAWFLSTHPGFDGHVLVVERDPSHEACSTAHSNSCMRQQFSSPLNVRVSQFAAQYIRNFREEIGDPRVPPVDTHFFGYLYLADSPARAAELRSDQAMQAGLGAGTRLLEPEALARKFPFFNLDGIVLGSWNPVDEGYFDGGTLFEWWRRGARARGVEFLHGEVQGIETEKGVRVVAVRLADGTRIGCGAVVNAAGPRAGRVAAMAGIELPVEPRKRMTWVVEAARPLDQDLPLTVDPSGVHFRSDGKFYMVGATPDPDPAVDPEDFAEVPGLWEEFAWPALAARIPQFERLRVVQSWAGHYAFNRVDQNAVLGPHPVLDNFHFINGFSGHGLQQAPAMGRGLAERIVTGRYQSLDLSGFGFERLSGAARAERAVI